MMTFRAVLDETFSHRTKLSWTTHPPVNAPINPRRLAKGTKHSPKPKPNQVRRTSQSIDGQSKKSDHKELDIPLRKAMHKVLWEGQVSG
jgi:hypothetical protein